MIYDFTPCVYASAAASRGAGKAAAQEAGNGATNRSGSRPTIGWGVSRHAEWSRMILGGHVFESDGCALVGVG
jgi:hypothetical protein